MWNGGGMWHRGGFSNRGGVRNDVGVWVRFGFFLGHLFRVSPRVGGRLLGPVGVGRRTAPEGVGVRAAEVAPYWLLAFPGGVTGRFTVLAMRGVAFGR